jgi:hypothetical protein
MMELSYDEAVHTYIGLTLVTVAAVGALLVDTPGAPRWRQHAWLVLALFLGWIVMGSNESYVPDPTGANVWWEPIKHLVTLSGTDTWWGAVQRPHVLQHKISALCIVIPALTEWQIRRRPDHPASKYLQWVLPLALTLVGAVFVIHRPVHQHAGHGMGKTPEQVAAELYQHYIFAAAFFAAAIVALTSRIPALPVKVPARAWYAFMAMGGLVFLTFRV